ncbi:MAG TPA: lytic murein transglycosylase [Methylophilus sp.]|nr:lytic murein transglycosylase [Methylophilus sp.]HQQ33237.1 lytic murein transglycosylase [Methylophilus sp.]
MILATSSQVFSGEKLAYSVWLRQLKQDAIDAGISKKTVKATFKDAKLLPKVVQMDRAQPEFISPFLVYLSRQVTPKKIEQGRHMLQEYAELLTSTETRYGIPPNILVAFWGMETNYGAHQGDFGLPSSLMTLAYDGRRASFFREQLIDVMRIVEAGHMPVQSMRGSWAGALGHMQFMPSTMLQHGVDADSDGKVDLKYSMPDAFASAANYLRNVGWKKNAPIMLEVRLPDGFDYAQAQLTLKRSTDEWTALGVSGFHGEELPKEERAAILLPQGWQGPALMVFANFEVVMDWNRSVNYALSVAHLAENLISDTELGGGQEAEIGALSFNQMWALQMKLNALGYDCGSPDGFPGLKTQNAIRQYQASQQLPQDGYASPSLLARLFSD